MNKAIMENYMFRNYSYPSGVYSHYPGSMRYAIWEAIRASSAAPGYFEMYKQGEQNHQVNGVQSHLSSKYITCPQTCNIRCTLVSNTIVDHSNVVGASPVGAAPTKSSLSTCFTGLGKGNYKAREETFKLWDLVHLIFEVIFCSCLATCNEVL